MSGKTGVPVPAVYARWCRADFPGLADSVIAERWRQDSDAEHEFWAALAAQEQPAPELAAVMADRRELAHLNTAQGSLISDLQAALSALVDRTEGSDVLTDDERDAYRKLARTAVWPLEAK